MIKTWMMILFVMIAEDIGAQWSSKDSLWIKDILSNKKEIKLKPEIIEAINAGNLINFDNQRDNNELISVPMQIPFSKDFTQYIQKPGSVSSPQIDYSTLPPAVFMLCFNPPSVADWGKLQSFSLDGIENYRASDNSQPILITDPLGKGQAGGGVRFMICLNDVIN